MEPIKETPTQSVDDKSTDKEIEANDLLLAMTPDGGCIGIKVKYGMPESFDTEQSLRQWLNEARERAIDLKNQIESGACTVDSVKQKLDMKPNLSEAMIAQLVGNNRKGLWLCILYKKKKLQFFKFLLLPCTQAQGHN